MKLLKIICLVNIVAIVLTMTVYAEEPSFTASLLTAKDVNCKKCHTDTPHVIHAQKPVNCEGCHGDKLSVSIPQCTKCHDGPIHKVHEGKVNTQTCSYCHKDIDGVHNALTSDAVCSHCHKNLIEVHGKDSACPNCHKSPPEIVKPLQLEGTVLICQNCHPQTSVATVHGEEGNKTSCYNCHKGTSKVVGSQAVHTIHGNRVKCENCHEANQQVFIPECTKCHNIGDLHDFNKIGKLTSQTGLQCQVCHPDISGSPGPAATEVKGPETLSHAGEPQETINVELTEEQPEAETPGFQAALTIGILITGYIIRKNWQK